MKRIIAGGLLLSALLTSAFAGDAAVLVDKGFSDDGNYYVFGQYGKTDKNFQAWAELYTVDVKKNDYVTDGVFKTAPSSKTASISGKMAFDELFKKASYKLSSYAPSVAVPDRILYIREEESKSPTEEIVFKDFTRSIGAEQAFYHVQLIPDYSGKGPSSKSSFFIMVEKKDSSGRVIARQKVGSPMIKRTGVTGYKIERIVCDKSGRNLVFIIEKRFEDATGVNIRYMIEAANLSSDFSVKPASAERKGERDGVPTLSVSKWPEKKPEWKGSKPDWEGSRSYPALKPYDEKAESFSDDYSKETSASSYSEPKPETKTESKPETKVETKVDVSELESVSDPIIIEPVYRDEK